LARKLNLLGDKLEDIEDLFRSKLASDAAQNFSQDRR
jgi:hypothetical protein